jgi:hypothetical protein
MGTGNVGLADCPVLKLKPQASQNWPDFGAPHCGHAAPPDACGTAVCGAAADAPGEAVAGAAAPDTAAPSIFTPQTSQ